jgi:hypothetical protein
MQASTSPDSAASAASADLRAEPDATPKRVMSMDDFHAVVASMAAAYGDVPELAEHPKLALEPEAGP